MYSVIPLQNISLHSVTVPCQRDIDIFELVTMNTWLLWLHPCFNSTWKRSSLPLCRHPLREGGNVAQGTPRGGGLPSFPEGCPLVLCQPVGYGTAPKSRNRESSDSSALTYPGRSFCLSLRIGFKRKMCRALMRGDVDQRIHNKGTRRAP
ncbi:hypothetical protein TNIN_416131 [Trichonephila inaurata madagascariensis]|uniref:Uncharacterized protein n=1 Tax=Trichonephila inaurata madagascariensis TaxID=2747483 RepID=A0A8X6XNT9_9ARAC|nr:hypothetical protein TNIN_157991 [Trichonephila inaurata madagascariensis]GFY54986.1 hypothetical protein TNIN_416131 [Trichonephila inaurata madagascariensis]